MPSTWNKTAKVYCKINNSSDAPSGEIGEYILSVVPIENQVSLLNNTSKSIASISLTAGDWDLEGLITFNTSTATSSNFHACIHTALDVMLTNSTEVYAGISTVLLSIKHSIAIPRKRISITSTTTVYLTGEVTFSAGSVNTFGHISARRVRNYEFN